MSYTDVAYNTVETPLSRKKSNSRGSSYNHRTKDLPKTLLKIAFKKRPYPKFLKYVAYKNADWKTAKILISNHERTEVFIRNVSQEFLSQPLLNVRFGGKLLWKCSSIHYRSRALPTTPPKLLYQRSTMLNFLSKYTVQKCRPKHCQKSAAGKKLHWNARHEVLVQKNCPKHHQKFTSDIRQYVKFMEKHPTKNAALNTVKKTDWRNGSIYMLVKKTSYIKACQNTVIICRRWDNRKRVKMLFKKVSYKKATQNTIQKFSTQNRQNWGARQKSTAKKADRKNSRNLQTEKHRIVLFSRNAAPNNVENQIRKKTLSERSFEKNCSEMPPETPLESAIYEITFQNEHQKSNVQERCQQHRQKNAIRI